MCGSDGCNRRLFTLVISGQDDHVHGGRCVNRSLCWERQTWTNVYIWIVDLYAGIINQVRACDYNTGTTNDIRMGHDVW